MALLTPKTSFAVNRRCRVRKWTTLSARTVKCFAALPNFYLPIRASSSMITHLSSSLHDLFARILASVSWPPVKLFTHKGVRCQEASKLTLHIFIQPGYAQVTIWENQLSITIPNMRSCRVFFSEENHHLQLKSNPYFRVASTSAG